MSNEAVLGAHVGDVIHHETHHDEHHEHHHHETFITKYVFSQDHKMIGKQFLITGMFWAVMGGLMSVLFRLQLGYPDSSFPWLEDILGKWAKGGHITAEAYYALVTTHGTVLVFFVLTAGLSGTFANLLIPLQVGARDMASPFMNMLSYWFFFMASVVMLSSIFVETGPFSGGWTAYPPLSALGDASPGSKTGMDLWIIAMALFVVSSLLGGLNYIVTILNMRTKGMTMTRLPLTIWALFFTAVLGVLSFPVLLSGFILLIFDRNFGTSFYLSDIFVNGVGALPNEGGKRNSFSTLILVLRTSGSIYHPFARDGDGLRNIIDEFAKADLWLHGDGRFFVCNYNTCISCLGTPHVCNRAESIPRVNIRFAYIADCSSFCYQSV
jgi:cytochrome c oxidase subunit 1